MCGINIILSDIPELLVLRVARAMIQNCQTGGRHQSNSAHHHLHLPSSHGMLHGKYEAGFPPFFALSSRRCSCSFYSSLNKGNSFVIWLSHFFHASHNKLCFTSRVHLIKRQSFKILFNNRPPPSSIPAQWWIRNWGWEYQRYHILSPRRWFSLSMGGNGIFTPNLRWSDSEFTCRISRDPGVMTSRLQVVQLSCVSDGTP